MLTEVLRHSVEVTASVTVLMITVESITGVTQGVWPKALGASRWQQYLAAIVLGAMPGCLGTYAIVTLYTYRRLSFGALVACMVATSGDESFVMLAMFPKKAVLLFSGLAVVGVVAGALTDALLGRRSTSSASSADTGDDTVSALAGLTFPRRLRRPSLARSAIGAGITIFILTVLGGQLGPESWNGLRWALLILGATAWAAVLTVSEPFLESRLWQRVVLRQSSRLFAWTFGALFLIVGFEHLDLSATFFGDNRWAVLGAASLLGIIPESGPQLLIVTLYDEGLVPLSTLVASSIVQDGHGMLPLLAASRIDFLEVKAINLVAGLLVGVLMMLVGW